MTLTFVDFPTSIVIDIRKHMPVQYDEEMVKRQCQPVVINPRAVENFIKQGHIVMACSNVSRQTIWVISPNRKTPTMRLREFWLENNQHFVPCCYVNPQHWSNNVPWLTLAKMTVKFTGKFLVFIPDNFNENSVDIEKCTFIESLQAYVLNC